LTLFVIWAAKLRKNEGNAKGKQVFLSFPSAKDSLCDYHAHRENISAHRIIMPEKRKMDEKKAEAHLLSPAFFPENMLMSAFLLSYFLQFGNEFFVVAALGTINGFVGKQTFQRLLACAVIGIAECLGKYLGREFLGQLSEALHELVCASALLCCLAQLVVVVKTM